MTDNFQFDPSFDFRSETPPGKDADSVSPTLRTLHAFLWSKEIQPGKALKLVTPKSRTKGYLVGAYADGQEFVFGSDAITHSYAHWTRPKALVHAKESLSEAEKARYLTPRYTVGSTMIWPVRSNDRPTINQARGTRAKIADRIDLTLECVRLHFEGGPESPLSDVLHSYRDFFRLFEDFEEFVCFFHFQDLVKADGQIEFFIPPKGFKRHGAPRDRDEYVAYREKVLAFIDARTTRMSKWMKETHPALVSPASY